MSTATGATNLKAWHTSILLYFFVFGLAPAALIVRLPLIRELVDVTTAELGIILLTASVNLLIGSASAKWALIGAIMVPMLMELGVSPDLTQAAYRVGDSSSNIITPLMPYFPLIVVFCQKYVKSTGIGTLIALMLPFSVCFLVLWSAFLLLYWALGIPLGIGAHYTFPAL